MIQLRHRHRFLPVALMSVTFGDAHCQESVEFESYFGGPWSDGARAIVRMADDGLALGGWTARESQSDLKDGWIVRVNDRGGYIWDLHIATQGQNGIQALSPALDGGLLAVVNDGTRDTGTVRLIKVSPFGALEWSKNYGWLGQERVLVVRPTFDGGAVMAGTAAQNSEAIADGWLVKLDRDYEMQWVRTFGGGQAFQFNDVALTLEGEVVGVGYGFNQSGRQLGWSVKLSALGATLWERFHDLGRETTFKHILNHGNGHWIFSANILNQNDAASKMVVGSLTKDGHRAWSRKFSTQGSRETNGLSRTDGNAYLAVATIEDSEGQSGLVVEFNADGQVGSAFRHTGNGATRALAITGKTGSDYAVTGVSLDTEDNSEDIWLLIQRNLVQAPASPREPAP